MSNLNIDFFFDLDEVVYNLSEVVVNRYNIDFNDNIDYKENIGYWWKSCLKAPQSYFEYLLVDGNARVFLDGQAKEGMVELINRLRDKGRKVYFLTAPQYEGGCYEDKVTWLQKHFDWFDADEHLIATANKKLLAKENRLLIDDNPKNLSEWTSHKGICIAFGGYVWTQEYAGIQADNATDLWKTISICEGWS